MDDPSVECPRGHRSEWVTLCKSCLVDVTKGTIQQALDAEQLRAALAASVSERKSATEERDAAIARSAKAHHRYEEIDAKNERLTEAARAVLNLVEDGMLVRDVSRDGKAGWSMEALDVVNKLAALQAALTQGE